MANPRLNMAVITLNANGLNTPIKDWDWQSEFSNVSQQRALYKTLNITT